MRPHVANRKRFNSARGSIYLRTKKKKKTYLFPGLTWLSHRLRYAESHWPAAANAQGPILYWEKSMRSPGAQRKNVNDKKMKLSKEEADPSACLLCCSLSVIYTPSRGLLVVFLLFSFFILSLDYTILTLGIYFVISSWHITIPLLFYNIIL